MEFEVTLKGADWLRELEARGFQPSASRRVELELPLTIQMGRAQHAASVRIGPVSR